MGLLTILAAPLAPVRLVVALGQVLQRQADQQLYSSMGMRRRLEALDVQRDAGELSDQEYAEAQEAIVHDLVVRSEPVAQPGPQQE